MAKHIIAKTLEKIEDKGRVLKDTRKENQVTFKGRFIKINN